MHFTADVRRRVFFVLWRIFFVVVVVSVQSSTREIRDKRVNFDDFETIKIIGRGAFGTVDLVRRKSNGQVYAMKTLSKFEMVISLSVALPVRPVLPPSS